MGKSFGRNDGIMIDSSAVAVTENGVNLKNSWPKVATINLLANDWIQDTTNTNLYKQTITISGITPIDKIDIQPDINVFSAMTEAGSSALYIENNNGVITACSIDAALISNISIQVVYYIIQGV